MPITEANIKILAAERNTDNPDGGGRLTSNVLQSGVDNNLFDDVDPLSRVTGNVQLRKFGAAVVAAGTDKYMGARLMIAKPPTDPKVHALLFTPQYPDDTRADAVDKMSSFLAPGGTYGGLLFGNHLEGMGSVIFLMRTEATPPVVGDVLYLVKNEGLITEATQFVQLTTVAIVKRTFTDLSGDFSRNQITCGISSTLANDFEGFEAVRIDAAINYTGKTKMRETVVADAAQYYGTTTLAEAATLGSLTVKATSIFEQLLPSSQIETVLLNRDPTPPANVRVSTGTAVPFTPPATWTSATNLQLPGACYPTSFSVTTSAGLVTDVAGVLRLNGADVGTIDNDAGIATLSGGVSLTTTAGSYLPAGTAVRAPQATGLEITTASRALNYAVFLEPPPAVGSVSVSYMAGGRWYVLADDAGGGLRGSSAQFGAGQVSYSGGFLSVTLGALPDIGSYLMVTWGAATQETKWPSAVIKAQQTITIPGTLALTPGSITITWTNPAGGGNITAADSSGTLTGAATGKVSYGKREITFSPNTLPAIGVQLNIAYSDAPKEVETFAHPSRDGNGTLPVTSAFAITPNSLEVEWNTFTDESVLNAYTIAQLVGMGLANWPTPVDPIQVARDDGNGNLKLNGVTIGTVNYATKAIVFQPDVTVKIPRPNYSVGEALTNGLYWRTAFTGITYIDAPSLYPNDTSGSVTLRYVSAAGGTTQNATVTFAPALDLIPGVKPALLPGSVLLSVGAGGTLQYIADNGVGTLRSYISNAWVTRGAMSYTNATSTLTNWPVNVVNAFTRLGCVSVAGEMLSSEFVFRTAAAPLKPSSFSIRFSRATGGVQTVTAAPDGSIVAAGVVGVFDFQTGICQLNFGEMVTAAGNESQPWYNAAAVSGGQIWRPAAIAVSTLRYTAVAYTYLPLGEDVLGVDPVRLPQDGRVIILKKARVVVVHHTKDEAPQTVTNATTINTGRTLLSWLKVYGANGIEIVNGFTKNLNAGTVAFTDVTGYSQPVTVRSRIETESLCSDALIDGTVSLQRPLAHNYPALETYISSVLLGQTLQAGVTQAFSQLAWTSVWEDTRIGTAILAQYDQTTYPIVVSNDGAITQRWALIFTSSVAYRLVGETRGEVITGTTGTVLSPVNPATGVAMFTLQPAGFGGGYAAGNVLRFNTRGAVLPAWCARTVEQSPPGVQGTDQILIEVRGAIGV